MKIRRDIIDRLRQWKNSENRKPILLKGARQTGKTWIMQEFGKECFEYVAEFNFDKVEELASVFEKTKDVSRILKELTLYTEAPIEPGKTLLIFCKTLTKKRPSSTTSFFVMALSCHGSIYNSCGDIFRYS